MITTCLTYCKSQKFLTNLAIVAVIFGAASVIVGGLVIFRSEETSDIAGNVVPFVVWFNFCAGFVYMAAAAGIYRRAKWSVYLAMIIAASTALVFMFFGVHIFTDGAFEPRTIGALAIRLGLWVTIACVARKNLLRSF